MPHRFLSFSPLSLHPSLFLVFVVTALCECLSLSLPLPFVHHHRFIIEHIFLCLSQRLSLSLSFFLCMFTLVRFFCGFFHLALFLTCVCVKHAAAFLSLPTSPWMFSFLCVPSFALPPSPFSTLLVFARPFFFSQEAVEAEKHVDNVTTTFLCSCLLFFFSFVSFCCIQRLGLTGWETVSC